MAKTEESQLTEDFPIIGNIYSDPVAESEIP